MSDASTCLQCITLRIAELQLCMAGLRSRQPINGDLNRLPCADNLATVLSGTFASPEPDIRAAAAISIGNLVASPDVLTAVASTTKPALVRGCRCPRGPRSFRAVPKLANAHYSVEL